MKKYYYIWKGQNATIGTPHPQTGLLNMYGDLIAFSSKKKRDRFYNEYYDNNPSVRLYKCSRTTCREYFLGWSVREMNEYIDHIVDDYVDNAYNDFNEWV